MAIWVFFAEVMCNCIFRWSFVVEFFALPVCHWFQLFQTLTVSKKALLPYERNTRVLHGEKKATKGSCVRRMSMYGGRNSSDRQGRLSERNASNALVR